MLIEWQDIISRVVDKSKVFEGPIHTMFDPSGHFGSLFQAIHLQNLPGMKAKCFDEHCPSLSKKDNKGVSMLKKRMCPLCTKYHSTIKSMNAHKRVCRMTESDKENVVGCDDGDDGESDEEEEKGEPELVKMDGLNGRNIFEALNDVYNI